MKTVCPNDSSHKRFITTASEVHDWLVDENGEFIKDLGCSETLHRPHPGNGNTWTCEICGAEAVTKESQ